METTQGLENILERKLFCLSQSFFDQFFFFFRGGSGEIFSSLAEERPRGQAFSFES